MRVKLTSPLIVLRASCVSLRLQDKRVDCRVQRSSSGRAQKSMTDDAPVVEDVERRPTVDVELVKDRPLGVFVIDVPPRRPGDFFLFHPLSELALVLVAVDAEQCEG